MQNDKTPVLFADMTRLMSGRANPTPTGIERVDLAFLQHLRRHEACEVRFVRNVRTKLELVDRADADALIDELSAKWPSIDASAIAAQAGAEPLKERLKRAAAEPVGESTSGSTIATAEIADFVAMSREQRANLVFAIKDYHQYFARSPALLRFMPGFLVRLVLRAIVLVPRLLYLLHYAERLIALASRPFAARRASSRASAIGGALQEALDRYRGRRLIYWNGSHSVLESREAVTRMVSRHGVRPINYVHDLLPIEYPEYFRPGEQRNHAAMLDFLHSMGAEILCNSQGTRRKIIDHAAGHGIAVEPRIARIGCAVTRSQDALTAPPPPGSEARPYVVIVGTIEGRKNHLLLLHLWRRLAEQDRTAPDLFVVGKRGWRNGSVLDLLDYSDRLSERVTELPGLSDADMYAVILRSRALLFPSFAEGWGMPAVEAMTLGVPVICSDIPELREATQGLADYLDPLDGPAWIETITDFAKDGSGKRRKALDRLKDFEPPTWSQAFGVMDEMLR